MATAVCPGIAWHSGTASAAYRRRCTTRPWVPRRLTSAAPCATTPCGSYLSGSKGRPTPGSQDSTATWPVPKPWSTCRNMLHRATPSPPRPPMAPCPCTVATLRCDPTTCTVPVRRCPHPSIEETWALTDGSGHKSTRSDKMLKQWFNNMIENEKRLPYWVLQIVMVLFAPILRYSSLKWLEFIQILFAMVPGSVWKYLFDSPVRWMTGRWKKSPKLT